MVGFYNPHTYAKSFSHVDSQAKSADLAGAALATRFKNEVEKSARSIAAVQRK
jgi:hypothetical protein